MLWVIGNFLLAGENPLSFDRGDLLRTAASLACVGNSAMTAIARHIFMYLSPRWGELGWLGWLAGMAGWRGVCGMPAPGLRVRARRARLAAVERSCNDACRHVAAHAPLAHAGKELPNGVKAGSHVDEIKAACKVWSLPTDPKVNGHKRGLFQCLVDQVGAACWRPRGLRVCRRGALPSPS